MSTTLDYLHKAYGPLMSLDALAETLDRSPNGLRVCLHSSSRLSDAINACRKRIGRRMYFNTEGIAHMLDDDSWNHEEN